MLVLTLIWMFLCSDGVLAGLAFGNIAESSAVFLAENVKHSGSLEAACVWIFATRSFARLGSVASMTHSCCSC